MCLQAHVVFAFEQSLVNMTQRLQRLAATTDQKVSNHNTDLRLWGGEGRGGEGRGERREQAGAVGRWEWKSPKAGCRDRSWTVENIDKSKTVRNLVTKSHATFIRPVEHSIETWCAASRFTLESCTGTEIPPRPHPSSEKSSPHCWYRC